MGLDDVAGRLFRKVGRAASSALIRAYFSEVDVKGLEHLDGRGPYIVAANHMGDMFDAMVLWTYLGRKLGDRVKFPAKKELFDPSWKLLWLNAPIMRTFGCIPVDRKNPGNIIDEFVRALEHGGAYDGAISIHFEGTSTPKGVLVGKAKTGFARAALRMPAEHLPLIVPTAMCYKDGNLRTAYRSSASAELLQPLDIRPWKERYDQAADAAGQYQVAHDLAERVRDTVVQDLQRKGFTEAPGIEGIY
jgi:1-acyl-sn-glycerol-3-phosphate acyltransferase